MVQEQASNVDRRTFFKMLSCAFVAVLGGCASTVRYLSGEAVPNGVEIARADLVREADRTGLWLVRSDQFREPVVLIEVEAGRFRALGSTCTHLGCQVRPHGEFLSCPCHGSTFDLDGQVVRGPAAAPLRTYSVQALPDRIQISSLPRGATTSSVRAQTILRLRG